MRIKRISYFKKPAEDKQWFEQWVEKLERLNLKKYERFNVDTSLGRTYVWGLNTHDTGNTLVIFPGARTTPLFWDFENGLDAFRGLRIFLVETNGLPNPSDGNTPDITSLEYGEWASELFEKLDISSAYIAGASFGGLICMKLCQVTPTKVKAAFLLNPGCLQPFSLTFKNLYYNILPILSPTRKNVTTFLDKAVFCAPDHVPLKPYYELILEYEMYVLKAYKDNTQKPYYMSEELSRVTTDVYLLEGDHDLLFPYQQSIANAKLKFKSLKEVITFSNVGHGIETHRPALRAIRQKMDSI